MSKYTSGTSVVLPPVGPTPGAGASSGGDAAPPRYLTKFAATPSSATESEARKRQVAALLRFARQQTAIDVMGYNRVRYCLRRRIDRKATHLDLYHSKLHQRARLAGVMTCGQVWVCPICGLKISEQKRLHVEEAIRNHGLGGGSVLFLTYTVSHGPRMAVRALLDNYLKAYRDLTNDGTYGRLMAASGYIGSIRALEATWGASNGFHPHAHALLFLGAGVDAESIRERVYPVWERMAARYGLTMNEERGLVVEPTRGGMADYFAKWGVLPESGFAWGPESEMTRWTAKRASGVNGEPRYNPFEFLDQLALTHDQVWAQRFREYAAGFRGRSQVKWSPGLRARLLEDPADVYDEELAGRADDDEMLLLQILAERYRCVVVTRMTRRFYAAANVADVAGVEAVLAEAEQIVREREAEGEDTHEDIF